MKNRLLIALFCVLFWSTEVVSQIENEVKRGAFPFMAILYYPDESVVDATGERYQHGAVLIKPDWLLSGAIDHSVLDNTPLGFPKKTLLARMGALAIDANFTFNEDEEEEEREVIQIVKPTVHSVDAWWLTDITLLQTLLPFKESLAIASTTLNPKRAYDEKFCSILVYSKKFGKEAEDKVLMQLGVDLVPPSKENCGPYFSASRMTCAVPREEMMRTTMYNPKFCQGNSGGPLICEGDVVGLQTYIENNCRQPHLYQLLASWDYFIKCGIEQKCTIDDACNICTSINKDLTKNAPVTTTTITTTTTINTTTTTTTTEGTDSEKVPSISQNQVHISSLSSITTDSPTTKEKNDENENENDSFETTEIMELTERLQSTSRYTSLETEPAKPPAVERIESTTFEVILNSTYLPVLFENITKSHKIEDSEPQSKEPEIISRKRLEGDQDEDIPVSINKKNTETSSKTWPKVKSQSPLKNEESPKFLVEARVSHEDERHARFNSSGNSQFTGTIQNLLLLMIITFLV